MRIETKTEAKPTHEQIQRRAYELWEKAGRPPERDQDFWLKAEIELRAQTQPEANGPVPCQITARRPTTGKPAPPNKAPARLSL